LYADALAKNGDEGYTREDLAQLVQCFVADAKGRIAGHFAGLAHNNDRRNYALAQAVLEGKHTYLRKGLVR
jgi:hypothetical protein